MPAVGAALTSTGGTVRTYINVPVASGTAFSITVNFTQTSTLTATVGKIALVGSDGNVLAVADAGNAAAAAGSTITYSGAAGHTLTGVKIFYSRENDTSKAGAASGGVNLTQIVRVQ